MKTTDELAAWAREADRSHAATLTDAQLAANIATYPEHGSNAVWRAACVAERDKRAAGGAR